MTTVQGPRKDQVPMTQRRIYPSRTIWSIRRWEVVILPYHTSTGPLGTGMAERCATPGSCMNDATIGAGR